MMLYCATPSGTLASGLELLEGGSREVRGFQPATCSTECPREKDKELLC